MSDSWTSAASEHVKASIAHIEFELAALIQAGDVQGVYAKAFIAKCAMLEDDDLFDAIRRLKSLKDFSSREFNRRIRVERETVTKPQRVGEGWETLLRRTEQGNPKPLLFNAIVALRECPEWQGVIGYNELAYRPAKLKCPPFRKPSCGFWSDEDDIFLSEWLQEHSINVTPATAAQAAQAVAFENPFHPVKAYLRSLEWDNQPRIWRWLTSYLGVERTPYSDSVGAKWLIGAVARIMNPGCQLDTCLVLEGPQGIRKSSALNLLGGDEWFTNQLADLENKDSSQDLIGKWILEIKEIDKFSKHELGVIKSYMDRRIDHYRPSYGRRSADFPRHCAFAASTNKSMYLIDETGDRRWWPVRCTVIDIEAIARDRDQLWAEAVAEWADGRSWWLEDESLIADAKEEQRARLIEDSWAPEIASFIDKLCEGTPTCYTFGSVSVQEILKELGFKVSSYDQTSSNRVARCLVSDGWIRFREKTGTRSWRYKRP